jgi:anti-anti-sigma factor
MGRLAVKYRKLSGVAVLGLDGDLDLDTVGLLRAKVARAFEDGYKDVVVVLDGLDFMDSAGLGVLVGRLAHARGRWGSSAASPSWSERCRSRGWTASSSSADPSTTWSTRRPRSLRPVGGCSVEPDRFDAR